jgi:metal-responsive CopG/Arc/MetJ family transcriptional regulator
MIHVGVKLDAAMLTAIEKGAARDERTRSDWIRLVLRRELRQLGLLPEPEKKGRDRGR